MFASPVPKKPTPISGIMKPFAGNVQRHAASLGDENPHHHGRTETRYDSLTDHWFFGDRSNYLADHSPYRVSPLNHAIYRRLRLESSEKFS